MSRLLPGLLDQLFSVTRFGTIHILRTSVQLVCVKREILMDSIFWLDALLADLALALEIVERLLPLRYLHLILGELITTIYIYCLALVQLWILQLTYCRNGFGWLLRHATIGFGEFILLRKRLIVIVFRVAVRYLSDGRLLLSKISELLVILGNL